MTAPKASQKTNSKKTAPKSKKTKTAPKPVSKTAASAAKKEVLSRLKDNNSTASVGLGKNDNGDYVVVVKFAKKPSKRLVSALSKGLTVEVQTEVVEAAVALSPKKDKALPEKLLPEALLTTLTQGVLKVVQQVVKKKASKKTNKKTEANSKTLTKK
jgi:hypothetical protein